jgi:hypothetical protein
MANTMIALQSLTVGSGGLSSVSFTSIPQIYTDLVVKISARGSNSGQIYEYANVQFNGVSTGYSGKNIQGSGSTASANNYTSNIYVMLNGSTSTSSSFGNGEFTIANYASSNSKSISIDSVMENNATASYSELTTSNLSSSSAITSISLTPLLGTSWSQHSTFTLYGIYNSAAETVPDTPTIGTATDAGIGGAVNVAFTPGANTGAVYTAISSPGSITGSNNYSPILVSGLTDGASYTFQVKAANPNGTSIYSSASNSATPVMPNNYESIASFVADGSTTVYTFSSIPQTYKHLQLRLNTRGTSSNVYNSWFTMYVNGVSSGTSYSNADLYGTGSTVPNLPNTINQAAVAPFFNNGPDSDTNAYTPSIIDWYNYSNTNINKTWRVANGATTGAATTRLGSIFSGGGFYNTSAITSVTISFNFGATSGSILSLYGIKG